MGHACGRQRSSVPCRSTSVVAAGTSRSAQHIVPKNAGSLLPTVHPMQVDAIGGARHDDASGDSEVQRTMLEVRRARGLVWCANCWHGLASSRCGRPGVMGGAPCLRRLPDGGRLACEGGLPQQGRVLRCCCGQPCSGRVPCSSSALPAVLPRQRRLLAGTALIHTPAAPPSLTGLPQIVNQLDGFDARGNIKVTLPALRLPAPALCPHAPAPASCLVAPAVCVVGPAFC